MRFRHRPLHKSQAGLPEITAAAALVLGLWLLAMGWDWSVAQVNGSKYDYAPPQSYLDWGIIYVAAALGAFWLGFRGRPIVGALAVAVPVLALSGWRAAASEVIGANMWPLALGFWILTLGGAVAVAASVGFDSRRKPASRWRAWIERRTGPAAVRSD